MNFKAVLAFGLAGLVGAQDVAAKLNAEDYVEAAWMTTRFFGAQRSGAGPNWILDGTNYTTSFTNDAFPASAGVHAGKDLSGGWFDCGDHVMFGQTQAWSSYILALGLVSFPTGWRDIYTGDYTDYKASGDYTRNGSKTNNLPDLLEELRYEADFWAKAAPDGSTFVEVKGNGVQDHQRWVTAGKMSTLSTELGGGTREIIYNVEDAYVPGMAAATLAIMARVDPDTDRQQKYLQAAINAYTYSKAHTGVYTSTNFYSAGDWGGRWVEARFLAAFELWRTTQQDIYKTEATTWFGQMIFGQENSKLQYTNAGPLAIMLGEKVLGLKFSTSWQNTEKLLLDVYTMSMSNGIFTKDNGSGATRSPAGGAFLYALYSVLTNSTSYDAYIYDNVDFLLGSNTMKKSYVVGYDRYGTPPPAPHHRGYYGIEDPNIGDGNTTGYPDSYLISVVPEKSKQLGGVILGGSDITTATHSTDISEYITNELCIDLTAPLTSALGYIVSKENPVGTPLAERVVVPTLPSIKKAGNLSLARSAGTYEFSSNIQQPFTVTVYDLRGTKVATLSSSGESVRYSPASTGVFQALVKSGSNSASYRLTGI